MSRANEEEESSDEAEEEKVVAVKTKRGQNKFTELEIKKMEIGMKISALERSTYFFRGSIMIWRISQGRIC